MADQQQQPIDAKAIVAILMCAVIWAVYLQRAQSKQSEQAALARQQAAIAASNAALTMSTGSAGTATTSVAAATPVSPAEPIATVTIGNSVLDLTLSNEGARPVGVDLKLFTSAAKSRGEEPDFLHLLRPDVAGDVEPMQPWFGDDEKSLVPAKAVFKTTEKSDTAVTYQWSDGSLSFTRRIAVASSGYLLSVTDAVQNLGDKSIEGRPGLVWAANNIAKAERSRYEPDNEVVAEVGDKPQRFEGGPKEEETRNGVVQWVGVDARYFAAALIPEPPFPSGKLTARIFRPAVADADQPGSMAVIGLGPTVTLAPRSAPQTLHYQLFLGPKDPDVLAAAGHDLGDAIAWGWYIVPGFLTKWLFYLLRWFHSWAPWHNWGVAIILLTILIRGGLSPIAARQMKTAQVMAQKQEKFKPELDALKKKYADDPMVLNQKQWDLMKQHGMNPFSQLTGCLPMLAQLPIWYALYRVLRYSIDLRHQPFMLWIHDLTLPDPYYILPILLGVVTLGQTMLTPASPGMDPSQQKMMKFAMPAMMSFFFIWYPAGLVLYIFTSTFINIIQQWILRRRYPVKPSGSGTATALATAPREAT